MLFCRSYSHLIRGHWEGEQHQTTDCSKADQFKDHKIHPCCGFKDSILEPLILEPHTKTLWRSNSNQSRGVVQSANHKGFCIDHFYLPIPGVVPNAKCQ